MQTLSEKAIVNCRTRQEPFAAVIDTGCFSIRVNRYIPAMWTAIHAGHHVREHIADKLLLNESERKYEEDTYIDSILAPFPIVLQGLIHDISMT